jgi:hypothetical protein
MKRLILTISLLLFGAVAFAQDTLHVGVPIYHNNGNIGIGEDPGGYKFRVTEERADLRFRSSGDGPFLRMSNGANWGLLVNAYSNTPQIGSFYNGYFQIYPFASNTGDLDTNKGVLGHFDFANMRVGIGNPSPQFKLDVDGDGRFSDESNSSSEAAGYCVESSFLPFFFSFFSSLKSLLFDDCSSPELVLMPLSLEKLMD